MKALNKKILTVCLALAMAATMAVPALAVGNPSIQTGHRYRVYPNGVTSHLLNVYGNGNENDNVTLYTPTGGNDQIWLMAQASSSGSTTYYYVISALSSNQSLNIYHATGNCQLHSWVNNTTNGKSDSAVYISPANRTIMLRDWAGTYLGFASVATNANVYWSSARCAWGWAMYN